MSYNKQEEDILAMAGGKSLGAKRSAASLSRVEQELRMRLNKQQKSKPVFRFGVAAAILFLVTTAYLLIPAGNDASLVAILADANLTLSLDEESQAMGLEEDIISFRKEGVRAYKRKDYESASQIYRKLSERFPNDADYALYSGHILIELGEYTPAITYLERALKLHQSEKDATGVSCDRYYLGLAYVEKGELAKAKLLLEKVVELGSPQNDIVLEANAILEHL